MTFFTWLTFLSTFRFLRNVVAEHSNINSTLSEKWNQQKKSLKTSFNSEEIANQQLTQHQSRLTRQERWSWTISSERKLLIISSSTIVLVSSSPQKDTKKVHKKYFQEKTFQSEKLLNSIERNVLTDVPFPSKNLIEWLLHVLAIDSRRKLESSTQWGVRKEERKVEWQERNVLLFHHSQHIIGFMLEFAKKTVWSNLETATANCNLHHIFALQRRLHCMNFFFSPLNDKNLPQFFSNCKLTRD